MTHACLRRRFLALVLGALASLVIPAAGVGAEKPATQLYLVGVGPGDADLATLRAIHVMKRADLVFCSNRIGEKFSEHLKGKELVDGYWRLFPGYGKDPASLKGREREQAERLDAKRKDFIARVRKAVADKKTVVILDNGDPLVYGPWAWCLEEFEDLNPVVVPGLSCFNAGNAALKRCVTTSDRTKSVILSAADWPGKTDTIDKLSVHHSTMVLFTMRAEFKDFIAKLSVNYPPETPVAVVKHAGYVDQEEVVQGTLATILDKVSQDALSFEYLIYVGDFLKHRYKNSK